MFERNDQQRRANDAPFRGMFGPGGRSRPMPQARPAMEPVPAGEAGGENGIMGGAEGASCLRACSLAMVYSPAQPWQDLFPPEQALREGTLFRALAKPFRGKTLSDR